MWFLSLRTITMTRFNVIVKSGVVGHLEVKEGGLGSIIGKGAYGGESRQLGHVLSWGEVRDKRI